MSSSNKIKVSYEQKNEQDKRTLINANNGLTNNREREIVFSFANFYKESIRCKEFNNFYPTKLDSVNAVKDFFESLSIISTYTPSKLSEYAVKEQFHYNQLKDDAVSRVESVLIDGYKMNKEKVEQFEGLYFEFQFSDGKRAIGTKIDENIFSILFLDPNHFICPESSRNIKQKAQSNVPAVFGGWNGLISQKNEVSKDDFIQMIIEEIQMGRYQDLEEIVKDLKDVIDLS